MIRIAVIGLGYWGPNLVRNFMDAEGATVAACCDLDPRRLERLCRRFPTIRAETSFDAVLADQAVDAVAIATPVGTHYELAKRALLAGKHVLVEKPLTARVDHAEELIELADKDGRVLMVDHVFVHHPAVAKVKEIVDSGRLGRLWFIDSVRINLGLFQSDVNVVWDLAPHDLSIVDHLVGRLPRSVSAFGAAHVNPDIEDVAYLNLDYGDGLVANFHVNWLSPVKVRSLILGGSEQSLIYNDLDNSEKIKVYNRGVEIGADLESRRKVLVNYRSGDVWSPNLPNEGALARVAADFVASIRGGRRPLTDGQAGWRVVRILDAAQRSIQAAGWRVGLSN